MPADDNWPLPAYHPGPRLHLHALGVIAITFAGFEAHLYALCPNVASRRNVEFNNEKFLGLSDKNKIKTIRAFFEKCEKRGDVSASINNLLDYFDWCQHCRNQLLHAERYPATFAKDDVLYLTKRIDKASPISGHVELTLKEIRDIAEKIRAGVLLCADLSLYLRYGGVPRDKIDPRYLPYAERLPAKLDVPERLELELWPKLN